VHLLQSRTDEAIAWSERARAAAPAHADIHTLLAAAYKTARPNAPLPNSLKPAG